jgi:GTP-binding protein
MHPGKAVAFALDALQDRGVFFIEPGENLYTGQIIGEYIKDDDLVVNAQKAKQLSNMRASGTDRKMRIAPPLKMSLEDALEYLNHDEYVEVTPKSIRLRKSMLDENDRKKAAKRAKLSDGTSET